MSTQNAIGRLDAVQSIPFTTVAAQSNPVGNSTFKIRLVATAACNISIGAAVNAYLPANLPEYFFVTPGSASVVTVTQATAAGTLNLVEIV
jgi:hypothetical protein